MNGFGNPFFQNRRLRSIQDSPQTQRARDMNEATRQFVAEDKQFGDFPSRSAFDQAIYDRAQGIATDRSQTPLSSISAPVPRFPITQGGDLGMDREQISKAATNEATRLGGGVATDASRAQVIQTPYGVMSATAPTGGRPATQLSFETSTGGFQGFDRPERYIAKQDETFQREVSGAELGKMAMGQAAQAGTAIRERIASDSMGFFGGRKPSQLYTTPSGGAIAAPTNMFGQPIKEFQDRYAQQEERLRGGRSSSLAALGSTGFGAMQREQASMVPPPVRNPSLFGGMGYASTLGGPQPASPMVAAGPITSRTRRRRIFGTV